MDRRILICGLAAGAFALVFAYSSGHDGPRRSDPAPATLAAAAPTAAPAPAAAMNPPPVIAPPALEQSDPAPAPDVDNERMLARGDRGAERGARSH